MNISEHLKNAIQKQPHSKRLMDVKKLIMNNYFAITQSHN